jgi:SAM-dependent methyltransferase
MENMSKKSKTREHGNPVVSDWVKKYIALIPSNKLVLDLACGKGRNTRFLLDRGNSVVALDKDVSQLTNIPSKQNLRKYKFDLEAGVNFPFHKQEFSGVIVTNYLYRPLFENLINSLSDGGVLIYQTFMIGNEAYGRPKNPNFLLKRDELSDVFNKKLDVIAFEQGYIESPKPAVVQSICAINC